MDKITPTVYQLRQLGYRVTVIHQRERQKPWPLTKVLNIIADLVTDEISLAKVLNKLRAYNPCGGRTKVIIFNPHTEEKFVATSICKPEDNYCKKIGVGLAIASIISQNETNFYSPNGNLWTTYGDEFVENFLNDSSPKSTN